MKQYFKYQKQKSWLMLVMMTLVIFAGSFSISAKAWAQNIVVLKTMPGLASAACSAIDGMHLPNMVGSLAGDDTAILIMRTTQDAEELCLEIVKMLDKK